MNIKEIHEKYRKKELSISEVVNDIFERIKSRENEINAFISLYEDEARERAVELEKNMGENIPPLYGIPIAVKDNISTKDMDTTCGSRILLGYKPPYNATVIERILSQGVIIIGKTNMDEFAMGSSGEHSYFGPTKNPHNHEYVPGGSSSGSSAAVAAGEAVAALGSDTGGSIRQPASFCGVVGLKPTYGRVSRYGLVAFGSSLDQIGPITTTVYDSAILFSAIAGFDPMDSTSIDIPVPSIDEIFYEYDKKRYRIGIPDEYFTEGMDEEVKNGVLDVARRLEEHGFPIKRISLPHTEYAISVYYIIATSEASSNLARYDGVRYGYRAKEYETLEEMYKKTRTEGFGAEVKRRILLGTFALSAGYYDAYYLNAQRARRLIKNDFDEAFKDVDIILTPVAPTPAFKIGEKIDDPVSLYLSDIFTVTASLAGLPAISIPCCRSSKGLPIGFQLIGRPFDEKTLFQAGRFYEEFLKDEF